MKKMILTVLAALIVAVPAVQAQKVNKEAILAKIEKSEADSKNPKKATKAATWLNLGKAYYEAGIAATTNIFPNMAANMITPAIGEPASKGTAKVVNTTYETWTYPYITIYLKDNKITAWKPNEIIAADALSKAIAAYKKAYELDPKTAPKVKEGLTLVCDYCKQGGDMLFPTGNYADAANTYILAYEAQLCPAYGTAEPMLLYFAGYHLTVDGGKNPASFAKGEEVLNKALEQNYADKDGDIYYYLYHCYYGQKAQDPANLQKAKNALETGIKKFPKNENILDGLITLYTSEKGMGDPADLIALIDEAIKNNPTNTDLWFGRGRTFYKLNNIDESIASFAKVVELKPEMFEGNYYLGLFYTIKGDNMNKALNDIPNNSMAAYEEGLKKVNAVYMQAVPYMEKAHQLQPKHLDAVNLLKQLCFRLRDEAGMMEKYKQYNELYNQLKK